MTTSMRRPLARRSKDARSGATRPVAGTSPRVGHGDDLDGIRRLAEDEAEREFPEKRVSMDVVARGESPRAGGDLRDRRGHGVLEPRGGLRTLPRVPAEGVFVLGLG